MAISAFILKIVEKDPFLRLQIRAKKMFNHLKDERKLSELVPKSKQNETDKNTGIPKRNP